MSKRLAWDRDGQHWPLRETSQMVHAGPQRWHVQRLGQGPLLLLLHGTAASTHSWRAIAPLLAPHFELIIPDLPGHAFSGPPPSDRRSLAGMAASLAELLMHLKLRPDAVLGHSAGAALMLRLALDAAWTTPRLLGLNAALQPFAGLAGVLYGPTAWMLARNPLVPRLAAWRANDPRAVRRLIEATGSQLDDGGVALYERLLRNPGHIEGVLAMMSNWNLHALQRDLPRLCSRLHLLVGERDRTVPADQADRTAARVAGAQVLRLPALGHLAHEEAPQRVADAVRSCLGC